MFGYSDVITTLVQAFISSRLDYCNSLLYGLPHSHSLVRKVQSVQNAAVRLLTGTRRGDHISPVLRQLHWLPVQRCADFKLARFVYSTLSGQAVAPPYNLAGDMGLVSEGPKRRLRILGHLPLCCCQRMRRFAVR